MQHSLAIIHNHFGPYHLNRAEALNQIYSGKIQLIQLASQELQRPWDLPSSQAKLVTISRGNLEELSPYEIKHRLVEYLNKEPPSALVAAGYSHTALRAATVWAQKNQIPTILLSDTQYVDKPRNFLKERLKGWWITKNFDAAFVAGASSASYLSNLGFSKAKIWRGYDVVNNSYFAHEASKARKVINQLRIKLKLPENFFLFVGRFITEKNLPFFLKAYQLYCDFSGSDAWSLVLVGSGPQSTKIECQLQKLKLNKVILSGFQQINDLPIYYALASALILPSISETWGLVVNEAMACGLPVLVSEQCGCFLDLVFPGINGYVFNPFKIEDIAKAMLKISTQSDEARQTMGEASKCIIANYTPETWAHALNDCVQTLLEQQNHRLSQS